MLFELKLSGYQGVERVVEEHAKGGGPGGSQAPSGHGQDDEADPPASTEDGDPLGGWPT